MAAEERLGKSFENKYRSVVVEDGVAILSIEGVLAKKMNLFSAISGGTSTQLLQRDFALALQDPNVHSILLQVDSPGGEVTGTQEFCDQIFAARGQKPIVAVCDGVMASAAYWLGSAADETYISSLTAQVGSIGVVATHMDSSQAEEKRGIKVTEVSAGKYKRVASEHAPLTTEGRADLQDKVDQIYTVFVDDVARNRGVSSEKVLSEMADGRVFIGKQAIDAGLVDGRRTTAQALQQLKANRQQLLYPNRSAAALTPGGTKMETVKENAALTPADVEAMRKLSFEEGATAERARIQAVEAQSMVGHEDLIAKLKFDGKTTGPEAAVQILAAEKKLLAGKAIDLRTDAPKAAPNAPAEGTSPVTQKVTVGMAAEDVEVIAKEQWKADPKLKSQYSGEAAFIAYSKAVAAGRVRILDKKPA
ncbi:MAG TPA: S49 family peptidase [Burkholderiales bacterium]|nr:S49 family peptidase [Burkholderiales bacterium]